MISGKIYGHSTAVLTSRSGSIQITGMIGGHSIVTPWAASRAIIDGKIDGQACVTVDRFASAGIGGKIDRDTLVAGDLDIPKPLAGQGQRYPSQKVKTPGRLTGS